MPDRDIESGAAPQCRPPPPRSSQCGAGRGATEGLLEKFRVALKDARDGAIAKEGEVTLEYVKAMYSKFVSTMGESHYNRELYRPDWMHLIRPQAFANLWMKAHKAYDEGLMVVRAMGTDELHVSGDWRSVFPEGRGVAEVKIEDTYIVGRTLIRQLSAGTGVSSDRDPAPTGPVARGVRLRAGAPRLPYDSAREGQRRWDRHQGRPPARRGVPPGADAELLVGAAACGRTRAACDAPPRRRRLGVRRGPSRMRPPPA